MSSNPERHEQLYLWEDDAPNQNAIPQPQDHDANLTLNKPTITERLAYIANIRENFNDQKLEQATPKEPVKPNDIKTRLDSIFAKIDKTKTEENELYRQAMEEREDAYDSLGGGRSTYNREGKLATGRFEDITESRILKRGKDGKTASYIRLELNGRRIDVPVLEDGDNSFNVERAKRGLIYGGGRKLPKRSR